jgi:hypothetical protein
MPASFLRSETPGKYTGDSQATIPKTKTAKNPAPLVNLRSTAASIAQRTGQNEKVKVTWVRHGIAFAVSLLVLSACASQTVKMIQPQTGATAECSGASFGIGPLFSESFVDGCARIYENRGYVAVQRLRRLTPEERANLQRRGLLPKD